MNPVRIRWLKEMGIDPVWRLRTSPPDLSSGALDGVVAPSCTEVPLVDSSPVSSDVDVTAWTNLSNEVAACRQCGLCERRQQAVLGVGDRQADWLFVGEGPGAEEDARGEPFVGQAGKLLDAMLAAIDLQRGERVYIANAVKCRPPGNRTPTAEEMTLCRPYLLRQIALIRPRLIVLLGRAAVFSVLEKELALGALRGQPERLLVADMAIPVVVTYHPAYLLRNLLDKAKAWEDLCLARRMMQQICSEGAEDL